MSTSSRYFNLQPSYSIDLNEDPQHQQQLHDHQILLHHHNFESLLPYSSSSSLPLSSPSSPSSPIYSNPDQIGYLYMGSQFQPSSYHQEVDNNFGPIESESCDQTTLKINKGANPTSLKFAICKKEDQIFGGEKDGGGAEISGPSVKWMPLRLMKKMMRGQDQNKQLPPVQVEAENQHLMSNKSIDKSLNNSSSSISSNNNKNDNNITTIRVCSDCNTTKTPLWRSGPRGPKSLCNACGIRQRKARRAMAMAINGPVPPNSMSGSIPRVGNGHKKASNNNNGFGAQKKRSKVAKPSRDHHHINDAQRKLCFEEFVLKLSKKFSLHQVFPQEEKEAAILLMALSCGFLHG